MKLGYLSQKSIWTVVGSVAILIVLSSLLLSRATFKADQPNLAIFFDPPTKQVQINDEIDINIKAQATGSAIFTATQLSITYDKNVLELQSAISNVDWQTKTLVSQDGLISWAMLPATQFSSVPGQEVIFGSLRFKALKSASAQIVFNQNQTIAATLDAASRPSLFNGITSYQNALITVSGENTAPVAMPIVQTATTQSVSNLPSAQRVRKIDAAPVYDSALVTVDLLYKGRLRIDFGETDKLGSTIEPTTVSAHHGVRLMGLRPGTRYYYKVTVISQDKTSQINSATRSLVTETELSTAAPKTVEFFAYPAEARDTTVVYAVAKDQDGKIVTGKKPIITADQGKVDITSVAESNGLYQSTIVSKLASKQTVLLKADMGSGVVASASLSFDPNYTDKSEPTLGENDHLTANERVISILVALLGGLVLLGFFFIKLARLK